MYYGGTKCAVVAHFIQFLVHFGPKIRQNVLPQHICFNRECTCQAKTVVGSSLTPHAHAALLVHPSSTTYPAVDRHEFIVSEKCCL